MTLGELRKALEKYPDDMRVLVEILFPAHGASAIDDLVKVTASMDKVVLTADAQIKQYTGAK